MGDEAALERYLREYPQLVGATDVVRPCVCVYVRAHARTHAVPSRVQYGRLAVHVAIQGGQPGCLRKLVTAGGPVDMSVVCVCVCVCVS